MGNAKEGQDIFVSMLHPSPGFFLDIGCAEPIQNNNTYHLEQLGWQGLMIDQNSSAIGECRAIRKAKCLCADVATLDFAELLLHAGAPSVIDYISLDVDDANIQVVNKFPFIKYEFKIMTFETDKYNCGAIRKDACVNALKDFPQYKMLLEDAVTQDFEWEDWWINTNYFNSNILEMTSKRLHWRTFLDNLQRFLHR